MEIGVRVMKENPNDPLSPETYCCHGQLEFPSFLQESALR
jgi:hypothetical protein